MSSAKPQITLPASQKTTLSHFLKTVDTLLNGHGATTLNNVNVLTSGLAQEVPKIAISTFNSSALYNKLIRSGDPDLVEDAMADVDLILDNAVSASTEANKAMTTVNREALVELVTALNEVRKPPLTFCSYRNRKCRNRMPASMLIAS